MIFKCLLPIEQNFTPYVTPKLWTGICVVNVKFQNFTKTSLIIKLNNNPTKTVKIINSDFKTFLCFFSLQTQKTNNVNVSNWPPRTPTTKTPTRRSRNATKSTRKNNRTPSSTSSNTKHDWCRRRNCCNRTRCTMGRWRTFCWV